MASWQEINEDIARLGPQGADIVRREKLKQYSEVAGRPAIIYAVEMYNQQKIRTSPSGSEGISVNLSDIAGFTEATRDIKGTKLDVILHSPGGSPEATESIVNLLRTKFKDIRFVVPSIAKSAATMMSMSGNEIILGENAELGPTDPQMVLNGRLSPAHAIIDKFNAAKSELKEDSSVLPAWLPILEQYGPSLLSQCSDAIELSEKLVMEWLEQFMFKGLKDAHAKAQAAGKYLAHKQHLSHARAIPLQKLTKLDVNIKRASEVSDTYAQALSDLDAAIQLTFISTGAIKFFENNKGKGIYHVLPQFVMMPGGGGMNLPLPMHPNPPELSQP